MSIQSPACSSAPPRTYKVLVAVAFEPTADAALQEGIALATRNPSSELHVVHAIADSLTLTGDSLAATAERMNEATEQLRRFVEAAWQQVGELRVIAHLRPGDPAAAIMQAAIDIDADVIVVGTHRRSGLRKLVLGSVAEQVLRGAHCPVLIALPKDYSGTSASPRVAPPCGDCLAARSQSGNAQFWCDRHSKPYLAPHIYVPRDQPRSSMFPTL
jgi:nucleotide-binding universal stress UspA family protein